jgi:UDP-N-acetylglucosamine--N-acetylmuramyl-(pentapeptide) pyrophosphoryl-undecaprenol N-acetylglucosamine transferase
LIKNISLPWKLLNSFFQVAQIVKEFKPDAVIGVGGYSSFPVLRYAQTKGIPTFIHESNSFAGKSNIILGKKATKIFTAIGGMENFFPASKIMISGNPVRQTISEHKISREEALKHFGFTAARKTVLIIGGSLGAKNINEAIDKNIDSFEKNNLQLIWQTGKPYLDQASERSKGKTNIYVNDFISQMEFAYAAADIIISRSGAMAVSEICLVKKPVVFVPYPHAAENHQTVNAQKLVNKNAGQIIKDNEALTKLIPAVIQLSKDSQKQETMKENISKPAIKNADEIIAGEILKAIS